MMIVSFVRSFVLYVIAPLCVCSPVSGACRGWPNRPAKGGAARGVGYVSYFIHLFG